jgi:copper(I)-binding protein
MANRQLCMAMVFGALAAWGAAAHEFKIGDLTIGHPYASETPPTAKTGAGYLSITNAGTEPDRLLEVRADFPRVQLHVTEIDADDVARMRRVEALEIPAGATVTLAPQGVHVMFMGLTRPLEEGEKIDATLVFERAGEVAVRFNVEPRGDEEIDHEGMDHGG